MKSRGGFGKEIGDSKAKVGLSNLLLLFKKLPTVDEAEMAKIISELEPIEGQVIVRNIVLDKPFPKPVRWTSVEFAEHKVQLVFSNKPVPKVVMEETIQTSSWEKPEKVLLRQHNVHVVCFYNGSNSDPIEQMICIYKVAFYFAEKGLIGALDETAWNCIPSRFIKIFFEPGMLDGFRKHIPLIFWANVVKFSRANGGIWLCSKGFHRFGIQDFAYLGSMEEIKEVRQLFSVLFNYLRDSGIIFKAGGVAKIEERLALRFSTPIEYLGPSESALGTLAIQKIDLPT
jgi:hypothetical protein